MKNLRIGISGSTGRMGQALAYLSGEGLFEITHQAHLNQMPETWDPSNSRRSDWTFQVKSYF